MERDCEILIIEVGVASWPFDLAGYLDGCLISTSWTIADPNYTQGNARIPRDIVLSMAEKGLSHWSARLIRDLGFERRGEYNGLKCDLSKDSGFKQFHANSVGR